MSDRTKRRFGFSIGAVMLLAVVIAGMLVVLSGGTATAKQIATLHIFGGQVDVVRAGATTPGAEGQSLREGDTVQTGPDGRAQIEYFDSSITRVDYSTTFHLKTLETIDNEAGSKVIEASQTVGGSYNRVTELTDSESRFDIDTPTATASVQGTVYAILVGPDGSTTIAVIEGMVTATSGGGSVDIPAGKMVTIAADGTLGPVEDIPQSLLDSEWLTFNQCELDDVRDCVLGEVVTPEQPEEEPQEPQEPDQPPADTPPAGPSQPTPDGPGGGGGSDETPNQDPQAGLLASSLAGPAPLTVSFADASSDPDGDPLSRQWDFGDGSSHTGGTSLLHTYTEPGDYLATLTVSDPDGASDSVSALVQVTDGTAPVLTITGGPSDPSDSSDASFSFTSSEAGTGFSCSLDGATATPCGAGSAGGILGIIQRIAAGAPASVSGSVSYSGLSDGPHGFTVSVTDAEGNTGSASWNWTIDTAPVLDHITISPSDSTITLGGSQSYTATAFDTDGVSMGSVTGSTSFSGADCVGNVCTPGSVGDKTVVGTYQGKTDSASLHVLSPGGGGGEEAVFDHIEISPSAATITYGDSQTYSAIAVDSNGASMGDVTAETTFTGANCAGNACTPTSAGPKTVTGSYAGSLGADLDDASLNVTKAPLQVTADDHDVTYGDADPSFTFEYSGFVAGDDAGDIDTPPTCGIDGDHQHVADYAIQCSGGLDGDYAFTYHDGTLAVGQAELTVTADDKAKVQGTANPTLTFGISGFAYSEDESVLDTPPTCSTTAVTGSPVGDYPITCSGGIDGDYSFSYVAGTLTVTEREVIGVIADDQTMTYGDDAPTFTFTYDPEPEGAIDTSPTCGVADPGVTSEGDLNAGDYTIECSGASDDVYDFSYTNGELTVEKKTLAVIPDDIEIDEGETPVFTFTYDPDSDGSIDTPPTCEAYPIEEGLSARLGIMSEGGFLAGEYAISCTGARDDNYDFNEDHIGTLTVREVDDEPVLDHIALSGPSDVNNGCTGTFTATLYDASNAIIDDDTTQVAFVDLDGGGQVGISPTPATASNGVATVSVTGISNGDVKLQASANGIISTPAFIQWQVGPQACGPGTTPTSAASTGTQNTARGDGARTVAEAGTPGETSEDRSRESGFRALGLVIVLPLLGLRRRRRR